jgi:ankyrin repeat protein
MSESESETEIETEIDVFDQFVNGDYRVLLPLIQRDIVHYDACDGDHGESILIWACRFGYHQLIQLVVKKGCDINHVAHSDGNTALEICEERKDHKMVEFLHNHGGLRSRDLPCDEDEDEDEDEEKE